MAKKQAKPAQRWANRIVGHSEEEPDQLLANPANFRRHPGNQRDALRGSLNEIGWVKSVLVNRTTGHVLDGHARVEEAITAGCTVPVDWVELSPEEERLCLAVLDPISEMATLDDEAWAALLADVETQDAGLRALLDSMAAEANVAPASGLCDGVDEDAVPEPPAEAITQPGDVITLGRHRLMCGDSTVITDVARLMDGAKADMVFTDPPYGVAYEGGHNKKKRGQIKGDALEGASLTELFRDALALACAFTYDHAAFYVWFASGKSVETFAAFAGLDLDLRAVLQWYKVRSGLGAFMSQYIPNAEPCIYAFKTGCAPQWFGPTDEKTVWELQREGANEFHPTQKPVALGERAMTNSSKAGDAILDLFGGSGSTLIAAEKTGRRCFMMELDPIYCDVICLRYYNATGKIPLREDGKPWKSENDAAGTENHRHSKSANGVA